MRIFLELFCCYFRLFLFFSSLEKRGDDIFLIQLGYKSKSWKIGLFRAREWDRERYFYYFNTSIPFVKLTNSEIRKRVTEGNTVTIIPVWSGKVFGKVFGKVLGD